MIRVLILKKAEDKKEDRSDNNNHIVTESAWNQRYQHKFLLNWRVCTITLIETAGCTPTINFEVLNLKEFKLIKSKLVGRDKKYEWDDNTITISRT